MSPSPPSVASCLVDAARRSLVAVILAGLIVGGIAIGITFLLPPIYTARTSFIPPQVQSSTVGALASLSSLSNLTGSGVRNPVDQYLSLLQSVTVADRIVDQFSLLQVYDEDFRVDARSKLAKRMKVSAGRRDGIIYLEVEDSSPQRAAAMTQKLVDEVAALASTLTLTEAQQRRKFFEQQVRETRQKLEAAQKQLQASGFGAGAINAEPRAAAEAYAQLRAQIASAEIRVQALRRSLTDSSPELQQQLSVLSTLQQQKSRLETTNADRKDDAYVSSFREFKYQEALLEVLARQYELARVDESREGGFIQIVDKAQPPERRTWPKRTLTAVVAAVSGTLLALAFVLGKAAWLHQRTYGRWDGSRPPPEDAEDDERGVKRD